MYEPRYKLTHTMLNNIVKLEVERKGILDMDINEEIERKARLSARASDIFHIGNIMGIKTTLKLARKIALGKTLRVEDYKGKYLTNFRNALEYIFSSEVSYYSRQKDVLVHLNKILINDVAEEWDAKYRTSGEEIIDRDDNWIKLRDEDIASVEVQSQALSALNWFSSSRSRVHPLIRIPAVIYRLIRLAPFVIGNKITILATAKYLFAKEEYHVNGYLSLMKNFDIYEEEYIEAWKQAAHESDDITLWIERFIRNLSNEMSSVRERIEKIQEKHREKNKQPFLDLNRRQLKVLRYLQNIYQVKREEYVEMMDVSTMTAYRDLNELVKKGLIRIEGKGRGTSYMLASR